MTKRLLKNLAACTLMAISLSAIAGCSSSITPVNTGDSQEQSNNIVVTSSIQNNSQATLLSDIKMLAQQGKIINSEYAVKTTVIDTIEKNLGKPDKIDWVPAAKGSYAVFSKYNVVYGFNKGSQIFEVRSFDSRLKNISISMVKKAYGAPAYDVISNGEEIIGYVASPEYKVLLVFPQPNSKSTDPFMDHYSVLYPSGTVNLMANDPGRKW